MAKQEKIKHKHSFLPFDLLSPLNQASLVIQRVKNPRAMQEMQDTWVQSLGGEDPLGEEMATHCSIIAWEIPQTEEPCELQSMWSQRVRPE